MPLETISLFTGQCGCQSGSAVWELFCAEHNLKVNGELKDEAKHEPFFGSNFFIESANGHFVPRAIFIDLEYTVIDEIRTGHYKNLFHPECLLSSFEDSANIFARGYLSRGSEEIPKFMETLRYQMEMCDSCECILSIHSSCGGSGSGFTALQFDEINDEFGKISKLDSRIISSGMFSSNTVSPYNVILSTHYNMATVDISFTWDNEALYSLAMKHVKIQRPTFTHINRLTAQVFSSLTACARFGGQLSNHLSDYQTNLVPYPRIHFPISSYSPIQSSDKSRHTNSTIQKITNDLFHNDMQFCGVDVETEKYVSCCLIYRGFVTPSDIHACIAKLKANDKIKFVDWCPTGMKVSICSMPQTIIPRSGLSRCQANVALLSNNSGISHVFKAIIQKFRHLYAKRAFVHWYVGEGLEEGEFNDAHENILSLIQDYHACYLSDSDFQTDQSKRNNSLQLQPSPKTKNDDSNKDESNKDINYDYDKDTANDKDTVNDNDDSNYNDNDNDSDSDQKANRGRDHNNNEGISISKSSLNTKSSINTRPSSNTRSTSNTRSSCNSKSASEEKIIDNKKCYSDISSNAKTASLVELNEEEFSDSF